MRVESRSYPDFDTKVSTLPRIEDANGIECPCCGGKLWQVQDMMDEQYTAEGWFERTERFYCEDCGTFADIMQRYKPTVRVVEVNQDMFDD